MNCITDVHTGSISETRVAIIETAIGEQLYRSLWDNRGFIEEGLVSAGTYSKLWNEIFLLASEILNE